MVWTSPSIPDETVLEQLLSEPTPAALSALSALAGDVILLGAGGKMGPSLARMVLQARQRAGCSGAVIAVSRFTEPGVERALRDQGIRVLRGDLLDERFVAQLPDAACVVFMTGMKFGTAGQPATTWAMNTYLPAMICRRYPTSRLLVFSTGNVYPLVPATGGGSRETDPPAPVGEYGMSALGRERICEYFSRTAQIPVTVVRLNYAVEVRYGVLLDLARQVLAGSVIDLAMGYVNVIWQGDANAMALAALADAQTPPWVVNVAGPERVSVREACLRFAEHFQKPVHFAGSESPTALLSDSHTAWARYGSPRVSAEQMIDWIADWLRRGMPTWDKPTHFQVRDGQF